MYIFVGLDSRIILGCANAKINEDQALKDGYEVFEIDDAEWSPTMLGSKLEGFEEI